VVDTTGGVRDGRQMCSDTEWTASSCLGPDGQPANATVEPGIFDGEVALLSPEPWAAALLSLAAANVVAALLMEAYVVCRASRDVPSRRHLFLGQMLLLGLFLGKEYTLKITCCTTGRVACHCTSSFTHLLSSF